MSKSNLQDRLAEVPVVVSQMFINNPNDVSVRGCQNNLADRRDRSRSPLKRPAEPTRRAQLCSEFFADLEESDLLDDGISDADNADWNDVDSVMTSASESSVTESVDESITNKFKNISPRSPKSPTPKSCDPLVVPADFDLQAFVNASDEPLADDVADHNYVPSAVIINGHENEEIVLLSKGKLSPNLLSQLLKDCEHASSPSSAQDFLMNFVASPVKEGSSSLSQSGNAEEVFLDDSSDAHDGLDLSQKKIVERDEATVNDGTIMIHGDDASVSLEEFSGENSQNSNNTPELPAFGPNLFQGPVLVNLEWFYANPGMKLRDALGEAGVCVTQLIMDAIKSNPYAYNLKKEGCWFSKNSLTCSALHQVVARLGAFDKTSSAYRTIFNSIRGFSGTYGFLKHSLDHGDFSPRLQKLQEKAEELRSFCGQNPERNRCEKMKERMQSLSLMETLNTGSEQQQGEAEQTVMAGQLAATPKKTPSKDKENYSSSPAAGKKNQNQHVPYSPRTFGLLQNNAPRLAYLLTRGKQVVALKQGVATLDPQLLQTINEKSPQPMAAPQFF